MAAHQNPGMVPRGNPAELVDAASISPVMSAAGSSVFTWEQVVRVLWKNRSFAGVFAVIVTAFVGIVAFHMRDIYQPVARLEVDPPSSGIKTLGEIQWNTDENDTDYIETQAQILQSDGLATSVIRLLHLDRNPEFVTKKALQEYEQSQGPAAANGSGRRADNAYFEEQFGLANRTPLESMALGVFQQKLAVNTVHSSRLIEVGFASHDPQLAQTIVNTLVTQFMDQNYQSRYTSTMQASEWLAGQLEQLKLKIQESNQAVEDYQRQYGFVEADDRDVPLSHLMDDVNHQLSDAQASRIEEEAFVRMIDTGQANAIPAVHDDQLYQNLMTRYVDARAQLAQAHVVYGEENASLKKLQGEVNELAAQVEAERTRTVNQVRTSYAAARAREQMMLQARNQVLKRMGESGSHMVAYRVLKNEALANTELYNTLKGRLFEAGIYAGLRSSNIHIVDLAPKLRQATGPHRDLIIAIGAMVSSMLALVFAFVKESLNNTVRTPDDIKDWTGLPSLAMIPPITRNGTGPKTEPSWVGKALRLPGPNHRAGSSPKVLLTDPHTAEGEAMRDLRTALMLSRPGTPPRVVLVASSSPGEGKTTVAINLAIAFSQRGTACLVDGDLRRPTVANAFSLRAEVGLSNVLTGSATIDTALAKVPDLPNLSLLPVGPLPPNPADLVASEQMGTLVRSLREKFDHVIIDSPPAIPFSDARVLSSLADAVILVGRYQVTTRRAISRCVQLFDEVRAPIVGVVVNEINLDSADYHYYNYGYSRALGSNVYAYYSQESAPPEEPPLVVTEEVKKRGAHA